MQKVVTYVEMTSPEGLRPGRPVEGLALRRVDSTSPAIPATQARIGAAYGWRSAHRTPQEWARWLQHPHRQYWLLEHDGETAGIIDLEPHDADVEITTFGLLPENVGRGWGGHALTLAVRRAWATAPLSGGTASRIWLHTSSQDHPNALRNYLSRGFRPFRSETVPVDVSVNASTSPGRQADADMPPGRS